ncbi:MAG: hypothetical protein [Cressdnaviricota sp.]|nr:MAG: hypothetical protein [Cressdnaviricota sp.]AXH73348.1 MAG: hypothetical protein [Cressdnaviricota sp.]
MSTPNPAASNAVLFQMLMHYKMHCENLEAENRQQRDILAMLQHEVHVHTQENRELAGRNVQMINGTEIIVRALDQLYELYSRIQREQPRIMDYRDDVHRIMMRGDVGFAILQGAPFVDLTANEDLDPDATESESESDTENNWI